MMIMDKITQKAVAEISAKYQPHTIIVYGFRARGDAAPDSDVDIACFVDQPPVSRDARLFNNYYLDAWVYSTESMDHFTEEFLKFESGFCAVDLLGLGKRLLDQVHQVLAEGPDPLSEEEKHHIKQWVYKTLERTKKHDVEGNYRRIWLQYALLHRYFSLRDQWFLGLKQSFKWLEAHDPLAFKRFSDAYCQPGNLQLLEALADYTTKDC